MSADRAGGPAFECRRCGHCCQGEGGIVLTPKDQTRLAAHLGLSVAQTLAAYAVANGAKPHVRTGDDGFCIFFREGEGCLVHPARPDVCRAWPFFRGNLIDEDSWRMIQTDCKGVNPDCGHAEFVRQGLAYLAEHDLARPGDPGDPNALVAPRPKDSDPNDSDPDRS
ncbi:MAG: YkgJ family cysteine cluster protein [Desulfovibrionaceae bacterium]